MTVQELQLQLIQQILNISNTGILSTLLQIAATEEKGAYIHPKGISFELWNKQFDDEEQQDKFDPELGMTLKAFRQKIWEAEQAETLSYEKYLEKTKHTTLIKF